MKKIIGIVTICLIAFVFISNLYAVQGQSPSAPVGHFKLVATYQVSGSVAEIVAATPDGETLIYTDSEAGEIGLVNISNVASPSEITTIAVGGEPTSVAITPSGLWALVVVHGTPDHLTIINLTNHSIETTLSLGGQPDAIAISPDGRYAAIAIENERDEDVNDGAMPQSPAGFLTIVDLPGSPANWSTRDVSLTGIAERFPSDPEPEFVDINPANQAAVTLQENNHVVIVDLASGNIISNWSAGTTSHLADLEDDGQIIFDDLLTNARREPDAIAWTPGGKLVTANEGDYDVDLTAGTFTGGRNFTIFSQTGMVLLDPGAEVEIQAAQAGRYADSRSDAKGCEIEGAEIGQYQNHTFLFVGAERCNVVAVYRLNGSEVNPKFIQILTTGSRPEGLLAIPARALFVSANEGDGTISIFQGCPGNPD